MDGRFNNSFVTQKEESGNMPESGAHSQFSGLYSDGKITSTTPKRSRRCVQKRMISLPIGEVEGSRVKGEGTPPFDSWTWRKYGQKPIKGSPYPRGYYRCSSSKGCPARKQVERSRVDPTMLVVTYSYEHNHPWPASRNSTTAAAAAVPKVPEEESAVVFAKQPEIEQDDKFADLGEDTLITAGDFSWFPDVGSSSPTLLDSPICGGNGVDGDVGMIFPMREEDESLFADLGELPEFSLVFRRGVLERDEERRGCSLRAATWCGSTG